MKEYTTERGVTIGIKPIPFLLDEIRKAHRANEPKAPVIIENLAGDATQEREITADTAALMQEHRPEDWEQYAEAWAAYEADHEAWWEGLNSAIWTAVGLESLQVDMPKGDAWIKRQHKLFGLDVPDDPDDRKLHYIRTEVVGGTRDYIKITSIANGGDIDEEVLAVAEDSFRGYLQRTLAEGLARRRESAAVEDEPPDGTGTSGETMDENMD